MGGLFVFPGPDAEPVLIRGGYRRGWSDWRRAVRVGRTMGAGRAGRPAAG
ncbi:MAG: hypothetical protein K9M94_03280 [Spirochaetia bacterium]|nr:hypothetical protein [Spirochaetia bacterium]